MHTAGRHLQPLLHADSAELSTIKKFRATRRHHNKQPSRRAAPLLTALLRCACPARARPPRQLGQASLAPGRSSCDAPPRGCAPAQRAAPARRTPSRRAQQPHLRSHPPKSADARVRAAPRLLLDGVAGLVVTSRLPGASRRREATTAPRRGRHARSDRAVSARSRASAARQLRAARKHLFVAAHCSALSRAPAARAPHISPVWTRPPPGRTNAADTLQTPC